MRSTLAFLIIALLLAACTGTAEAPETQVDVPVDDTSETPDNTDDGQDSGVVVVTLAPDDSDELEVPLPGTHVASATEDPNAGLIFDQILFARYGGPEGSDRIEIELLQDGSYTLNGNTGSVRSQKVTEIDDIIDAINFYGMQGALLGPSPETEDYRYSLTVIRGEDERTINAQDGFFSREVERLFASIMGIALGR